MKYILYLLALFFLSFQSCNEIRPKGEKEVKEFINQWNNNHTSLKAPYLENDYMSVVHYYGKDRSAQQVMQDKLALFEQFPEYSQEIVENSLVITKEGPTYLLVYDKIVKYQEKEATFESYLSVVLKNGSFKILREGVRENASNKNAEILPKYRTINISKTIQRQLFGDFNGDGLSDYAFVEKPQFANDDKSLTSKEMEVLCSESCVSTIRFSTPTIAPIEIKNSYQSQLENLQDINGDFADEVGFWDIKSTSKTLYIYDVVEEKLLTPPVYINTEKHKNLKLIDVFKKTGPSKITVTQSEEVNGKWKLVSKVVELE